MAPPSATTPTDHDRPVAPPPASIHLPQLDGLRALAASFVVLHHAYIAVWPFTAGQHPPAPFHHFLSWLIFGRYAVNLFIVLSGFCLAIPVIRGGDLRGGAWGFARGRVRRIVPPYYVAIALSVALMVSCAGQPPWDSNPGVNAVRVASCLLFLCDVVGVGAINGVFWSIAVEAQIYTLYPAMVATWKRLGLLATAVVFSAFALTASYLLAGTKLHTLTLWYVPLFLMGVMAASIALADWGRLMRLPWGWLAVAMGAVVFGMNYVDWDRVGLRPRIEAIDLTVGLAAACFLTAVVGRPGWAGRLLAARPLVFVGTFAYSIYLIHCPLLALLIHYVIAPLRMAPGWEFAFHVGGSYPLVLVASYGFFLAFERPFLGRRRVRSEEVRGYPHDLGAAAA